jgi:F-type H+-transporting ATPase subunit a
MTIDSAPGYRLGPKHATRGAFLALLLATSIPALGADEAAQEIDDGNPNAVGHAADGYYFDLQIAHRKIELPRLLLVRGADGALRFDVFASTHAALESGHYTLNDGHGARLGHAEVDSLVAAHSHIYYPMVPAEGHTVIDFSITRQILFVFLCEIILLMAVFRLAGRYKRGIGVKQAPKGFWHNMMEVLVLFVRDEIAKPAIGPKYSKYTSYLTTAFLFVLLGNLVGLVPWGVTATSNIMVTGTLALFTFVITQFSGTKDYWRHIFWPPGVPVGIKFILIPIEVIGIFTKPIALAFRLFGNMISGHIAIASILGLIFIFAAQISPLVGGVFVLFSVPLTMFIYLLKILVSLIQAYIFTMLSAVFIGLAVQEHHEDHHAAEGSGHGHVAGAH